MNIPFLIFFFSKWQTYFIVLNAILHMVLLSFLVYMNRLGKSFQYNDIFVVKVLFDNNIWFH